MYTYFTYSRSKGYILPTKPIDFLEIIFKKDMSSVPKNQQYVLSMNILFYKRLDILG